MRMKLRVQSLRAEADGDVALRPYTLGINDVRLRNLALKYKKIQVDCDHDTLVRPFRSMMKYICASIANHAAVKPKLEATVHEVMEGVMTGKGGRKAKLPTILDDVRQFVQDLPNAPARLQEKE